MPENLRSPSGGEFDVCAVLWQAQQDGEVGLKLAEIHKRVCSRRESLGEPKPALSTISGQLRQLFAKGLLEELRIKDSGECKPAPKSSRGVFQPSTRSPLTGYRIRYAPAEVLQGTFAGLAGVYPHQHRTNSLSDFANAVNASSFPEEEKRRILLELAKIFGISDKIIQQIEEALKS